METCGEERGRLWRRRGGAWKSLWRLGIGARGVRVGERETGCRMILGQHPPHGPPSLLASGPATTPGGLVAGARDTTSLLFAVSWGFAVTSGIQVGAGLR